MLFNFGFRSMDSRRSGSRAPTRGHSSNSGMSTGIPDGNRSHPRGTRFKGEPWMAHLGRPELGSELSKARRLHVSALQANLADDCYHSAIGCLSAA